MSTYRDAMESVVRRRAHKKIRGERCTGTYVANLTRLHSAMQQSDVSYWEPPQRVGMKRNKTWLAKAVTASVAHRRNLKAILGVKDSDICQVNVFAMYALGTAKNTTFGAIAQSLESCLA